MHTTAQQFEELHNEAWKRNHATAMECGDAEDYIARMIALWDSKSQEFASVFPGADREKNRRTAADLRAAEQAMSYAVRRAFPSVARGYTVVGLDRLVACLNEARVKIVMPTARRMAAGDPQGRSADELASLIVRRCKFVAGRAVISEEVAAELPCPFDPEPSA